MKKRFLMLLIISMLTMFFSACSANTTNSNGEQVADSYIAAVTFLYDDGVKYDGDGLTNVADYMYGTAAASASSMRYAVDCLLYMKGEGNTLAGVVGDRLNDWDEIAALGYASPYPYLFEGIVEETDGKTDAASDCYQKAACNPDLLANSEYLKTLLLLDKPALKRLKAKLTALEDKIFAVYAPAGVSIPRNENNFDAAWLRAQGRDALGNSPEDYEAALAYYLAALSVDPYDGDNYAGCAVLYMYMEDAQTAIRYLNAGLFVDPENDALNTVLKSLEGVV